MSSADGLFRQPKSFRRFIRPRPAFFACHFYLPSADGLFRQSKSFRRFIVPARHFPAGRDDLQIWGGPPGRIKACPAGSVRIGLSQSQMGPRPSSCIPCGNPFGNCVMLPTGKNMPSVPLGRIPTAAVFSHPAADCRPCQRIPADIRRIHASSRHTCRAMHPLPGSAGKRCIGGVRILEKCGILIARKNLAAQGFFFMPSLREPLKLRGIPF